MQIAASPMTDAAVTASPVAGEVYPGIDGFLGTRGSLMLDVVVLAMVAVVPVLLISIALVKFRQLYSVHKTLQLMLGAALLVAVVLFEIDIRLHGWQERAVPSPYFDPGPAVSPVEGVLYVHLVFAISAAVLWAIVIVRALRQFPSPPVPGVHSASHIFWARLAALSMVLTAVTGWSFYWLAFVASK